MLPSGTAASSRCTDRASTMVCVTPAEACPQSTAPGTLPRQALALGLTPCGGLRWIFPPARPKEDSNQWAALGTYKERAGEKGRGWGAWGLCLLRAEPTVLAWSWVA